MLLSTATQSRRNTSPSSPLKTAPNLISREYIESAWRSYALKSNAMAFSTGQTSVSPSKESEINISTNIDIIESRSATNIDADIAVSRLSLSGNARETLSEIGLNAGSIDALTMPANGSPGIERDVANLMQDIVRNIKKSKSNLDAVLLLRRLAKENSSGVPSSSNALEEALITNMHRVQYTRMSHYQKALSSFIENRG
jgi:hypothetical protein